MPIDASIYGNIKQFEAPSVMESAGKAMNLSAIAQQQAHASKKMEQDDSEQKRLAHLQKASTVGNMFMELDGLPEEAKAIEYPKAVSGLMSAGIIGKDELLPHYDPGYVSNMTKRAMNSMEGIKRQLTLSEIDKNKAVAMQKESSDPLARQVALMGAREDFAQRKANNDMKRYSQVGGWKLAEGAAPTMDDAKKFKTGVSAARSLLDNLNEFQSLVKDKGAELVGKDAQRMESLARDIQLTAKNEDLYGLGVLTGPDLMLLEELIKAPTGVGDFFNPMAGSKAANKTQQFREMLNRRINAKAKTIGFEPEQEWTQLAGGGAKQQPRRGSIGPNEAYAELPAIKHGTVEDGFVYMGGDPADSKSWKKER